MANCRGASKVLLVVALLFTASCGTTSSTETPSTVEPQKTETAEVTSSPEPPETAKASTQNSKTTESTRVATPTTTTSYSQDGIFFPKQKGSQRDVMQTRGRGQLIMTDNGCLRLETVEGQPPFLLIWPPEYSLNTEGGRVRIVNDNGQVVAEVGDYIEVGGGATSLNVELISESLRQKLPERCSPPYYAVGEEVQVVQE